MVATATVELTALELGMLLRVCHEKLERGAGADDLFMYDVAIPVVTGKLGDALAELDTGGA